MNVGSCGNTDQMWCWGHEWYMTESSHGNPDVGSCGVWNMNRI